MYLIICKSSGGAWTYFEGEGFGITYYESREEALRVCRRLEGLGLPWTHEVKAA